jgi:hypothetical protein
MKIIIISSRVCRALTAKLEALEALIRQERREQPSPEEVWLDTDAVCAYLKISKRTLQRYRSNGTIAYSLLGHKTYYAVSEIERLLAEKRIFRNDKSPEGLESV